MISRRSVSVLIGFLVFCGAIMVIFGVSKSVASDFGTRLKNYFIYVSGVFSVGGRESVFDVFYNTIYDVSSAWRDIDGVTDVLNALFFSFITPFRLAVGSIQFVMNVLIVILKFVTSVLFGGSL